MSDKPKLVNPVLKSTLPQKSVGIQGELLPTSLTSPEKPNRRAMHIMLPMQLWWRLSQHALHQDLPRSDVVIRAIEAYLAQEGA